MLRKNIGTSYSHLFNDQNAIVYGAIKIWEWDGCLYEISKRSLLRAKKYENEMVAYTKSPEEVYCKRNARDINFYFYFTTY